MYYHKYTITSILLQVLRDSVWTHLGLKSMQFPSIIPIKTFKVNYTIAAYTKQPFHLRTDNVLCFFIIVRKAKRIMMCNRSILTWH